MNVCVYGTLLSGEPNNRLLKTSEKLGDTTVVGFQMYDLGWFPACIQTDNPEHEVTGEVWSVTDETLERLDGLEGYPTHYDRVLIDTSWGAAWIYVQKRVIPESRLITSGNWKQHLEQTGRM